MKKIDSGKYTWVSPGAREFSLEKGHDQIGELRWEKATGSLATGRLDAEQWSFKRVGYFHPHVTVRRVGTEADIGRVVLGIGGGGSVQFRDGERYDWTSNLWRSEWGWMTPSGRSLVRFHREFGLGERSGSVEIPEDHLQTIHLPLLVVLGWYLIVLLAEDAAIAQSVSGG
ncbi:MAG TPA: hypothetical protein VMT00_00235 [Thermoanaerobaculia bacterium]|nr:hypothetical protein [Thermoanaerobaculia bacterium]